MPPRRRRHGYRPGVVSDALREAVASEAVELRAVEGAVARIDAVSEALAAVDGALDDVRAVRLGAVAELRREGWSYDRIAAASSLSKSRVKQLVVEAEGRGLLRAARHRRRVVADPDAEIGADPNA